MEQVVQRNNTPSAVQIVDLFTTYYTIKLSKGVNMRKLFMGLES